MSILGVVVRARPEHREAVSAQLSSFPGLDLAVDAQDGRFVIVIEDTDTVPAAQTMAAIALLPDVLNTSLVYEYSGPDVGQANATPDNDFHYQAWRGSLGQKPNSSTDAAVLR